MDTFALRMNKDGKISRKKAFNEPNKGLIKLKCTLYMHNVTDMLSLTSCSPNMLKYA